MKLLDLCKSSNRRVEENNHFCYWQVDGYKLDNKHLVLWYEKQFNSVADFVYRDFEKLKSNLSNTSIDMGQDYHLNFLKKLRNEYRHVKLLYSGGTDSATILDMAHKHGISINETITLVIEDINLPSNAEQKNIVLPSLERYKSVIEKSSLVVYSHHDIAKHFDDKFAMFSGPCDSHMPVGFTAAKYHALEKYYGGKDTCVISGMEKPQIMLYNGRWYAACLDPVAFGDQSIPNVIPFYIDADNIKGYIKDCILFRNHLLEKGLVNDDHFQFFQPDQTQEHSEVIGRIVIQGTEHQLIKTGQVPNKKTLLRFNECFTQNNLTTLTKYLDAVQTFYDIFPETKTKSGLEKYNNQGKFAWFVDIDSLKVFTQQELIPNGFIKMA